MSALLKITRNLNKNIKCSYCIQTRLQQTVRNQIELDQRYQENVPVFRNATHFAEKIALKDTYGNYTYGNLFITANHLSEDITKAVDGKKNERILFLCPNDAHYVITQWAIWLSGQIAVPLSPNHPEALLQYYCEDSDAKLLVTTKKFTERMQNVAKKTNKKLLVLDENVRKNATRKIPKCLGDLEGGLPNKFYDQSNALILYTSGTTGKPKGVVLSHRNLQAQVHTLIEAWKWSSNDVILHCLPLNHTHGIVNALLCPLNIGAKCVMMKKFDKNIAWGHLLGINTSAIDRITVFMGVPTMYAKLIEEYELLFTKNHRVVEHIETALKNKIRLMVSGSAPLPMPLAKKWELISGHRLLERYGMTEIGMCLSHEYDSSREPGYVGIPLPGVSVKLGIQKENGEYDTILQCNNNDHRLEIIRNPGCNRNDLTGELLVKGETVFKEYFNKPEATKESFTSDGWFKTGDTAMFNANKKLFKLMGRTSVDIIKTGGFKVSALEIETHILGHPAVEDCTVVGVEDPTWGQKVAAVVVLKKDAELSLEDLRAYCREKIAEYAVPSIMKVVDSIPKNQMGKVTKKDIINTLFTEN